MFALERIQQFQFHKGTIRTDQLTHNQEHQIHFNSIKVRLERNNA